jgi:hypothetical protein
MYNTRLKFKIQVFRDGMLCLLVGSNQCSGGVCCFRRQSVLIQEEWSATL